MLRHYLQSRTGSLETVAYLYLEPDVEPVFHPVLVYQPGRSAHDALQAYQGF